MVEVDRQVAVGSQVVVGSLVEVDIPAEVGSLVEVDILAVDILEVVGIHLYCQPCLTCSKYGRL